MARGRNRRRRAAHDERVREGETARGESSEEESGEGDGRGGDLRALWSCDGDGFVHAAGRVETINRIGLLLYANTHERVSGIELLDLMRIGECSECIRGCTFCGCRCDEQRIFVRSDELKCKAAVRQPCRSSFRSPPIHRCSGADISRRPLLFPRRWLLGGAARISSHAVPSLGRAREPMRVSRAESPETFLARLPLSGEVLRAPSHQESDRRSTRGARGTSQRGPSNQLPPRRSESETARSARLCVLARQ